MNLTRSQNRSGFTLVEIMIVVAIIGLLATIAIPNMVRSRQTAQKRACISNLRVIDGAKDQWAIENRKSSGSRARRSQINAYIKGGTTPKCPSGGSYTYGYVDNPPSCNMPDHVLMLDFQGDPGDDEE